MKKAQHEFLNKFHLLNSQENSEEIIWSSSESSDYENIFGNKNIEERKHKTVARKRKRNNTKNKSLKNISNLDITEIFDENKQATNNSKSPILKSRFFTSVSPTLSKSKRHYSPDTTIIPKKSPILSFGYGRKCDKSIKSPILLSKNVSPKHSPKVRKKLFDCNQKDLCSYTSECEANKRSKTNNTLLYDDKNTRVFKDTVLTHKNNNDHTYFISKQQESIIQNVSPIKEDIVSEKTNIDLFKRVKSFFDSNFTSDTNSQNSISECESTPQNNSKTSEETDIISWTDESEKSNLEILNKEDTNLDLVNKKKSKIFRYKKDGLAYRFNSLLKKQNANISLWQHERFLANNSKFTIPTGDFTAFRIQNVQFKYGCYLINAKDVNNDIYSIIINSIHGDNATLEAKTFLKLYNPYKCFNINNHKVIVNVIKFECDKMNCK